MWFLHTDVHRPAGPSTPMKPGLNTTSRIVLLVLGCVLLVVVFYMSPLPFNGADWLTYHEAAIAMWHGQSIYSADVYAFAHYYSAPWLIVGLAPLALLPVRLGYALFSVLNLGLLMASARRFKLGRAELALLVASPPVVYTLLYRQSDILVVSAAVLVPAEWSVVAALAKPHAAIALALRAQKAVLGAILATAAVLVVSLILFGPWPLTVLRLPTLSTDTVSTAHNIWNGFSPGQFVLGVVFLFPALKRDEEFMLAASPFLSPYAETYSFLGPALAAIKRLPRVHAALPMAAWWAAVLYRWFVLGYS
jgi:hypothetical protein